MMAMQALIPRVSIGLPVFNGEPFLEATLNALLAQTYPDFELIISDNASTDQTEAICREYAAKDRRMFYHRHEKNLGAARNYNRVFELSRGEYFKWAAADDLCAPDFLARCVEVLDHDPEIVVCYAKTKIIDAHGAILGEYEHDLSVQSVVATRRFLQVMRSLQECNAVFGLMRSNILRRTGLIGNYIAADGSLLAELSLYGKIYQLPAPLFFRRDHPQASSRNRRQDQQLEFFDPRLKGRIVFPKWRRVFENFVAVKRAPLLRREKVPLLAYLAYRIVFGRNGYGRELVAAAKQFLRNHPDNNRLCKNRSNSTSESRAHRKAPPVVASNDYEKFYAHPSQAWRVERILDFTKEISL
jgi:glycosyltransferase involved in cell wall biosynthesis